MRGTWPIKGLANQLDTVHPHRNEERGSKPLTKTRLSSSEAVQMFLTNMILNKI
jgi:hypothetical protein